MYLHASDKLEVVIPLHTLQYSQYSLHICLVLLFVDPPAIPTLTRVLTLLWWAVNDIPFQLGGKGL